MTDQDTERSAIQAASLSCFLTHKIEGIAVVSVSLPPPDDLREDDAVRQQWKEENSDRNIQLYSMVQAAGYPIWRIEATWAFGAGERRNIYYEKSFAVLGANRDDGVGWCQALQVEKALYLDADGLELLSFDCTRESLEGPVTSSSLKNAWSRVREHTFRLAKVLEFPVIVPLGWSQNLVFGFWVRKAQKLVEQGLPVYAILQRILATMDEK